MIPNQLSQKDMLKYRAYHGDGLIDIILGFMAAGFGLSMLSDSTYPFIFLWMFILFLEPLKKWITAPRMASVDFEPPKKNKAAAFVMIGVVTGIVLLGLVAMILLNKYGISEETRASIDRYIWLGAALLIGVLAFTIGILFGIKRLYIYAGLGVVLFGGNYFLELPGWIPVVCLGGGIIATGAVLLVMFIRKYPKAEDGAPQEGQPPES